MGLGVITPTCFLLVIVERIDGRTDDDRREGIKPSTESKVFFGEKKTGSFERIETFTKTRDVDLDSSFERGHGESCESKTPMGS